MEEMTILRMSLGAAGIVFMASSLWILTQIVMGMWSLTWYESEGRVVDSKAFDVKWGVSIYKTKINSRKYRKYICTVQYLFGQGQSQSGCRIRYGSAKIMSEGQAHEFLKDKSPGNTIAVYVDPLFSRFSVLERGLECPLSQAINGIVMCGAGIALFLCAQHLR